MLLGKVVNNSGRGKHIFKRNIPAGGHVSIEDLYNTYRKQYVGVCNGDFLDWLKENKIPEDFDLVLEEVVDEKPLEIKPKESIVQPKKTVKYTPPHKMTVKQLSNLKVKDNPKDIIKGVLSIHKLRRVKTA